MIGELAALGTAGCWAFTGLFFAEAARRVGSLRVNLLRLPIALVMLSAALALTGSGFATLRRERLAYLAASAIVGLVAGDLALFATLRRIGPRLASLLMALAPLFATWTGALFLAEKPGRTALAGMALTLGGVAWVVSEKRGNDGDPATFERGRALALGVFAAACQGVGLVLAKLGMAGEVPPLTATWVRIGIAAATIWLLTVVTGRVAGLEVGPSLRSAAWPVLGGAFFGPFAGVWLSLMAAKLTDVGVAATLMATSPVLIIPLVMAAEHYRPSARALVGTVVTVAGVALLFAA